jgi:hypothetical protein
MLRRIEDLRDDADALQNLRLAVATLPPAERRILIEELRRRSGRVEVVALRGVA